MICQDVYDYYRGDTDLGYYYAFFDSEDEVRERLSDLTFAPDWGERSEDRCHAIVDLLSCDTFHEGVCVHPRDWLRSLTNRQS